MRRDEKIYFYKKNLLDYYIILQSLQRETEVVAD